MKDWLVIGKKTVIANFPINTDMLTQGGKKKIGEFIYLTNDQLTVDFLLEYAQNHHKAGREGQSLIVIDEAGIMFNSRDYASSDRKDWLWFMSLHRHFGYNIIMASQHDRMIDRQMRYFIEYNHIHRKANNFKFIGFLLTLLRIPLFISVQYWYALRLRCSSDIFVFRKKDGKLYDTMLLIGDNKFTRQNTDGKKAAKAPADAAMGAERSDGGPMEAKAGAGAGTGCENPTEEEPAEVGS
jgi:hypothetical protein